MAHRTEHTRPERFWLVFGERYPGEPYAVQGLLLVRGNNQFHLAPDSEHPPKEVEVFFVPIPGFENSRNGRNKTGCSAGLPSSRRPELGQYLGPLERRVSGFLLLVRRTKKFDSDPRLIASPAFRLDRLFIYLVACSQ